MVGEPGGGWWGGGGGSGQGGEVGQQRAAAFAVHESRSKERVTSTQVNVWIF